MSTRTGSDTPPRATGDGARWEPYAGRLRTHRLPGGGYSVHVDGARIGDVVKTGSHLDDYPWDWSCADGAVRPDRPIRGGMVADTKRAAVAAIAYHCGWDYVNQTWEGRDAG